MYCYGTERVLAAHMVLIDEAYARAYPRSIPDELQEKVLRRLGVWDIVQPRGRGKEEKGNVALSETLAHSYLVYLVLA